MRTIRDACAALWHQLNPSEPSSGFLATFFASAMVLFAVAYIIGTA